MHNIVTCRVRQAWIHAHSPGGHRGLSRECEPVAILTRGMASREDTSREGKGVTREKQRSEISDAARDIHRNEIFYVYSVAR